MNTQIKKQLNKEQERLEKRRAYVKKWYIKNIGKMRLYHRKWKKEWRKQNPGKEYNIYKRKYNIKNAEKIRIKGRENMRLWRFKNPERARITERKRLATNVNARISVQLRSRLYKALIVQLASKQSHLKDLIGTTIPQLRSHLERKFQPGMSWDNYGKWHIDHIKPMSAFDLTKLSEQKKAMHYSNLQPMWAIDNLRKGAKVML